MPGKGGKPRANLALSEASLPGKHSLVWKEKCQIGTPLGDTDFMYALADGPAMLVQYGNKKKLCDGLVGGVVPALAHEGPACHRAGPVPLALQLRAGKLLPGHWLVSLGAAGTQAWRASGTRVAGAARLG